MIVLLIVVGLVGFLNAWFWCEIFNALANPSFFFSSGVARLGFFLGAKILILALFFYYVLHHAQLNFILVLVIFLSANWLGIKRVVLHGKS